MKPLESQGSVVELLIMLFSYTDSCLNVWIYKIVISVLLENKHLQLLKADRKILIKDGMITKGGKGPWLLTFYYDLSEVLWTERLL